MIARIGGGANQGAAASPVIAREIGRVGCMAATCCKAQSKTNSSYFLLLLFRVNVGGYTNWMNPTTDALLLLLFSKMESHNRNSIRSTGEYGRQDTLNNELEVA